MSDNKQNVLQLIHGAVDEINEILSEDRRLEKTSETVLLGETGRLDSLGLINFIVTVETRAEKTLGLKLNLGEAMPDPDSPLSTLGSLTDFILNQREGESD